MFFFKWGAPRPLRSLAPRRARSLAPRRAEVVIHLDRDCGWTCDRDRGFHLPLALPLPLQQFFFCDDLLGVDVPIQTVVGNVFGHHFSKSVVFILILPRNGTLDDPMSFCGQLGSVPTGISSSRMSPPISSHGGNRRIIVGHCCELYRPKKMK